MIKRKIREYLEEKYDYFPQEIHDKMIEYAEENSIQDLNMEELHKDAIESLEDDGGMFPNDRDYDAEDEDFV